eukprot:SAG22_NODE_2829_length_2173_cov_0.982160_2_plen_272_part_00
MARTGGRVVLASCLLFVPATAPDVLISPWGPDSFRVRVAPATGKVSLAGDEHTALLPGGPPAGPDAAAAGGGTSQTNGNLRVELADDGRRVFSRVSDGKTLLTETLVAFGPPMDPAHILPTVNCSFAVGGAELYGLGQQRQACYKEGGFQTHEKLRVFVPAATTHLDLARGEGGAANTLPWLTAASHETGGADFGFWLNNPAMGSVDFDARAAGNRTMTWQLAAAPQLDYIVTTGSAAAISAGTTAFQLLERFTSWVGTSSGLPEWALGYW